MADSGGMAEGTRVWIPDDGEVWCKAEIIQLKEDGCAVVLVTVPVHAGKVDVSAPPLLSFGNTV